MIQLKVEECPSSDYVGEYIFHKNLIYIGANIDADLYLEDGALVGNHLLVEIVDGQLLAHLGKDAPSFWVDGKLATKFKFLAAGNVVKIGSTKIRIVLFAPTSKTSKREVLNKNTDELIQANSPLLDYIKDLQREL